MTAAQPADTPPRRDALAWIGALVAVAALAVVTWACLTSWGGVVHGHPAYAVWLGATVAVAALALWRTLTPRRRRKTLGARAGRIALIVLAVIWVGLTAWLRPYSAVEPALAAMSSDATVDIVETPTEIVMTPRDGSSTGLLFQPGALVDPRAYAAVLRPVAEAGHPVVIVKQPLGIAFLAAGAIDGAARANPEVEGWVVGGHSLGGTVAAMTAAGAAADDAVAGLLLFASYPAGDISSATIAVESISGTRDGLSTPAKIDASRADLPEDTLFTVIDGASYAQFGDYGAQVGDGTPTISHDDARRQISDASVAFLDSLDG